MSLFFSISRFIPPKFISLLSTSIFHLHFSTGRKHDPEDAMKFIRKLYEQQAVTHSSRETWKTLYPHFTCATDTNNIRRVFSDVKDTVLLKSLRDYGIIWTFTRQWKPGGKMVRVSLWTFYLYERKPKWDFSLPHKIPSKLQKSEHQA